MKVHLNETVVKDLKPTKKRLTYFHDTGPTGFCVRVTPSGVKSYAVFYRHAGRLRLYTIGKTRDCGGEWYFDDAKKEASKVVHSNAVQKIDLAAKKQEERVAESFGELAEDYMKRY